MKDELIKQFLPRIVCTRSDLGPMKNNSAVPDSPKTAENRLSMAKCVGNSIIVSMTKTVVETADSHNREFSWGNFTFPILSRLNRMR